MKVSNYKYSYPLNFDLETVGTKVGNFFINIQISMSVKMMGSINAVTFALIRMDRSLVIALLNLP